MIFSLDDSTISWLALIRRPFARWRNWPTTKTQNSWIAARRWVVVIEVVVMRNIWWDGWFTEQVFVAFRQFHSSESFMPVSRHVLDYAAELVAESPLGRINVCRKLKSMENITFIGDVLTLTVVSHGTCPLDSLQDFKHFTTKFKLSNKVITVTEVRHVFSTVLKLLFDTIVKCQLGLLSLNMH